MIDHSSDDTWTSEALERGDHESIRRRVGNDPDYLSSRDFVRNTPLMAATSMKTGLRRVVQIERALRALDPENIAGFVSIANAIEVQLENSPRDPAAIRLLAQAVQALVRSHEIDPRAAGFASPLEPLLRYVP